VQHRRVLGLAGEHAAERELVRRGYEVVARNLRTRFGEIDLICRDRIEYLFVEVKTRRAGSFVRAAEAVDRRKAQRLAVLAQSWLAACGQRDARWRIVLAALTVDEKGTHIELIDVESD
jgi:putative endonuclease